MRFLLKLAFMTLAVWLVSRWLPAVRIDDPETAFIFVIVLAVLNVIVKPILILLTIPITIITLGIFLLFINAIIILIADALIDGFHVDGFLWTFIFSLILSVVNSFIESLLKKERTA